MTRAPDPLITACQEWSEGEGSPPFGPGDRGSRQWLDALIRRIVWPYVTDQVAVEHRATLAPEWGIGRNVPVCIRCTYGDGASFRWPCPTLQQIGYPPPPPLRDADMRHDADSLR